MNHRYIDGLVQERRSSIANAMELRLSYTNPLIFELNQMSSGSTPINHSHNSQAVITTCWPCRIQDRKSNYCNWCPLCSLMYWPQKCWLCQTVWYIALCLERFLLQNSTVLGPKLNDTITRKEGWWYWWSIASYWSVYSNYNYHVLLYRGFGGGAILLCTLSLHCVQPTPCGAWDILG